MNTTKPETLMQTDKLNKTQSDSDLERFPIRVLAEKTSVGTSTIRAWERRYGLLQPERTPKGHRLYSENDVKRIRKIMDLLDDGHSLPNIAQMLAAPDQNAKQSDSIQLAIAAGDDTSLSSTWDSFIQKTLEATGDFNVERIDAIYNEASSLYPLDMVTDRLIQPTIKILGEAWKTRPDRGVAEEHFYTSWLKNRLGARFHHAYNHARGARIICACMPGSFHEIGLMLFSLSALARGYRVLYFGADLPLDQLPYIAKRSAAKAVVLGAQSELDSSVNSELPALIKKLDTPLFIGGNHESIDSDRFEQAGGILLGNNISVAIKVFESHLPVYSAMQAKAQTRE
ncbi:MAG: MerR family transcriptional regulator [Gammaproteobacteria bacterium]|nr:MerR family transcriptional regulator [Gammaproteobacteria bacterium]